MFLVCCPDAPFETRSTGRTLMFDTTPPTKETEESLDVGQSIVAVPVSLGER